MTESSTDIRHDQYLDAKGLNCPLPVLKAKLALTRMEPGQILCVDATDPHATIDFQAYCARTGHDLIETCELDEIIRFYIRRTENPARI